LANWIVDLNVYVKIDAPFDGIPNAYGTA
jgi:hypothetical protein